MRITVSEKVFKEKNLEVGEIYANKQYTKKMYKKLADLEDIEDELNIELSVLFKAIKNGVWAKNMEQGIHFISLIDWNCEVSKIDGKLKPLYSFNVWDGNEEDADDTIYFIKDYGKTWALTKEELE